MVLVACLGKTSSIYVLLMMISDVLWVKTESIVDL